MAPKQSKYWCFTINNYTDDHIVCLHGLSEDPICGYLVFGYEVGDAGTPHLQGYVEFVKKLRLTGVKKLIAGNPHLELRRGTGEEAASYCKKEGEFEEFGALAVAEQGRRTDLAQIKERIAGGAQELEIADNYFSQWVVYRRSFEAYRSLLKPAAMRPELKVYVLWGPAGSGKTSYVHRHYPECYVVPSSDLRWFQGYNGELTVLVDDFEGGADVAFFKRFLDIYKMQVPTKGGFVNFHATTIFITSNFAPPWGYINNSEPINRRISKILRVALGPGETIEQVHQRVHNEIIQ